MLDLKEPFDLARAVLLVYHNDERLLQNITPHERDRLRSIETDEMAILADAVIEAELKD